MKIIQLSSALGLILLAGCQNNIDTETERGLLLQTDREFSEYSVAHGAAEAFKAYLLENALQLPAGENPVYGRDHIYQEMLKAGDQYALSWEPQDGDVSTSGDLGFTWGIYTISFQDENGKKQARQGKYLNIWQKDSAGNWRVLIDMGNQNPRAE